MSDPSQRSGPSPYRTSDRSSRPSSHPTHWSGSIRIVLGILVGWFLLSLGCGVLFRDVLDETLPNVGNAPFGFWMAQQGSIIGFVVLLFVYMMAMNRLDRHYGYGEGKGE